MVILLLSGKKCHAKQIFVLSTSMKLGPDCKTNTNCIGTIFQTITVRRCIREITTLLDGYGVVYGRWELNE